MRAYPELVGGLPNVHVDMLLMQETEGVAKVGAENMLCYGFDHPEHGGLGMAIKGVSGGFSARDLAMVAHAAWTDAGQDSLPMWSMLNKHFPDWASIKNNHGDVVGSRSVQRRFEGPEVDMFAARAAESMSLGVPF